MSTECHDSSKKEDPQSTDGSPAEVGAGTIPQTGEVVF